jgi:hypothetical protein
MLKALLSLFWWFSAFLRSRNSLGLEILALRQQLSVLKQRNARPRLSRWDQLFWVVLRRIWSGWAEVLVVVKPETVVRWHRAGFRLYWRFLSRRKEKGRPRIGSGLRKLIERMAKENPTWGAPRIHGELLKLGFDVSERTVSRYLFGVGRKGDARKLWLVFLKNHREVIAAMDFFTVPTATFRVLYCFFVISHRRREVLHFNATEHPTSGWIGQQLREAFPDDTAPRYVVETLAPDGPDQALNVGTLPRRSRRSEHLRNTQALDRCPEEVPINRIAIPQEIARRAIPGERLSDLTRCPFSSRVGCDS